MTLNSVMAIILHYSVTFVANYVKVVDYLTINRFSPEKCYEVHHYARRTRCVLRGSGASCYIGQQMLNLALIFDSDCL